MLTNSAHKVIMSTLEDFPQIEFRCTLMLSMHSLRYIGEQMGFDKLTSDYRFILPKDKITKEEKDYCIRDNDVVAKYVVSLIDEFSILREIPYTKTGRVRKTYKKIYAELYKKVKPIWDLMPPENCYQAELDAFGGGCVFSNPMLTAIILHNVHSYDITSSYPFAMLSELFPYTIIKLDDFSVEDLKKPFWIAKIKFNKIRSNYAWQWLSVSKMNDYDIPSSKFFNGKLICSNYCIRTITNVDYETICKTYTFDSIEILEFYDCVEFGALPEPYIETIKVYAKRKHELKMKLKEVEKIYKKGSPEWNKINSEYTLAKNDFNSIYGMCVQKLVQSEYIIDEFFQWKEKDKPYVWKDKHIQRNFLFGVYITAYARRNLINAIIVNCPHSFVYCDTDSVKFIGTDVFIDTNKELPEEYKELPYLAQLGRFDKDDDYSDFITYGAKKYGYKEHGNDEIYLTVAGLPHYKAGDMEIEFEGKTSDRLYSLNDFVPGVVFKNCKNGHKYITTEYSYDLNDEFEKENIKLNENKTLEYLKKNNIKTRGGVALYSVDYALDITKSDRNYILKEGRFLREWAKTCLPTIALTEYCDMTYLIA